MKRPSSTHSTSSRSFPSACCCSNQSGCAGRVGRLRLEPPDEVLVVAHPAFGLDQDGQPLRALRSKGAERRVEAAIKEDVAEARVHLHRELDEQVVLVLEVVEDRAAREAGRLLEPDHRRAVVAVLGECAACAVEDLGAAGLEMLLGHLGHGAESYT